MLQLLQQLREDRGARANAVGLLTNMGLAAAKLVVAALSGSAALLADAFNSTGDIFATAVAYGGYSFAQRPPDENHHYGHGNAESVAGLVVGAMLFATGVFISIDGAMKLLAGVHEPPQALALAMALVTMVIKEGLYRYTLAIGQELNAPSLLASCRDHRADVFVGLAVFLGVLGARLGAPWIDPAAAMLIGVYIAAMAVQPLRQNAGVLMDEAPPALAAEIGAVAAAEDGVISVESVRVHPLGSYLMVDLEIAVDATLTLALAHDIAHRVQDRVMEAHRHVRDVKVHVNPAPTGE